MKKWERRWQRWRGEGPVETDLSPYRATARDIAGREERLRSLSDRAIRTTASALRSRACDGAELEDLLPEWFALVREIARREIGLRPFDVQVMAGTALHRGRLVEMQTGEGKTLAAVLPAALHALTGRGVHILTFNDYLARRDAAWMKPVYEGLGLRVGVVQEGMHAELRRDAYAADVTYATAKEAGFDFLRSGLVRCTSEQVQRPFHFAIVDEADSILIDEARVPLVIAGDRETSEADPYRIAEAVAELDEGIEWETDEHGRNVHLTERGMDRVEEMLACGNLHESRNALLLAEVNQALHARTLLRRDVDYIVRDGRIALVDEFTGRIVVDRRWPDGLQAALEAKEGLDIQPGGQILGSITLQHFLAQYPTLAGMTATAQTAADEFAGQYGMKVVPIPLNRTCIRDDRPDIIFADRKAKERALIQEITRTHVGGRPILVGTRSVEESEHLAHEFAETGISCRVLNARNDESEAEIVAEAGALGAVTISTNMAGRGTDIRLGGAAGQERDRVVALGGLYVIGTNRHESRRIDDQLRGRAGRQGDPGTSRFFVSLEDPLFVRYGIDNLIPPKLRPSNSQDSIDSPIIRREIERLQRIVQGQNEEIRVTLSRYSALVEKQRASLQAWRLALLTGQSELSIFASYAPERFAHLCGLVGLEHVKHVECAVTLHQIDAAWSNHLALISEIREGIHLVGIGGLDPLHEFHKQVAAAYRGLHQEILDRVVEALAELEVNGDKLHHPALRGPSSTWTYLVNDRVLSDLQQMLFGHGSSAFAAGAVLMTWPLLMGWALWHRISQRDA